MNICSVNFWYLCVCFKTQQTQTNATNNADQDGCSSYFKPLSNKNKKTSHWVSSDYSSRSKFNEIGNHHDKKVNGAEEAGKKRYSSYSRPLATMQQLLSLLCLEVPQNFIIRFFKDTFRSAEAPQTILKSSRVRDCLQGLSCTFRPYMSWLYTKLIQLLKVLSLFRRHMTWPGHIWPGKFRPHMTWEV